MGVTQVLAFSVGVLALAVGLKTIFTQKISVNWDADDEGNSWVYGRLAIAVGCVCLLVACFLFAGAMGLVPLSLDWHG